MSASEAGFLGSGVPTGRGVYHWRFPRELHRAVARMRMPERARRVLDEVLSSMLGPDERYRQQGVPIAVRTLAFRLGCSPTPVQQGVAWLLDRGVLVRRADGARRNAYRYQVAHPTHWSWPSDGACPESLVRAFEPDRIEGWGVALLRFAPGTPGEPPQAHRPQLVHSVNPGVRPGAHTRARSSSPEGKNTSPEYSRDPAMYYTYIDGRQVLLVDIARHVLDTHVPGWESLVLHRIEEVPAWLAAEVQAVIHTRSSSRQTWHLPWIRRAIVRAFELSDMRRQDEAERVRREGEAKASLRTIAAAGLIERWHGVQTRSSDLGLDATAAAKAMAQVLGGNLAELEIAEILVEQLAEAAACAVRCKAAAPPPSPTPPPETPPLPPADPGRVRRLLQTLDHLAGLRHEAQPAERREPGRYGGRMEAYFAWRDRIQLGERAWVLSAEIATSTTPALVDQAEALVARAVNLGLWTDDAAEAEVYPESALPEQPSDHLDGVPRASSNAIRDAKLAVVSALQAASTDQFMDRILEDSADVRTGSLEAEQRSEVVHQLVRARAGCIFHELFDRQLYLNGRDLIESSQTRGVAVYRHANPQLAIAGLERRSGFQPLTIAQEHRHPIFDRPP